MANVWKIGSRWSSNGSWESRIISIFRRSEAVFLGSDDTERFNHDVEEGDYFAIADGYCIPCVAKAVSNPMPLNDMIAKKIIKVRKGEPFDVTSDYSGCYGVKVKIVDLPESKHLYYEKRGTFFRANAIAHEVKRLYEENLSRQFDIQADTYRIMSSKDKNDNKQSIINNKTIYNIPVYQREYSWGRTQVSRFVVDIFKGFWGSEEEKNIIKEPMFIGTMQLSYKKYIKENENEQDVIDGQQRLSTILCILKYLKLKYPQNEMLKKANINWLETKVNNGKEDLYLNEMLSLDNEKSIDRIEDTELNRYLKNIRIIKETFEEQTSNERNQELPLFAEHVDDFIAYFLSDIYFVVVETIAGLSKTIQIFNTINTAGLDLSGNDLFKVRLYEYLHDKKNFGEEAFNEIGDIYKNIKDLNSTWRKNHDWDVVTVGSVRSIYKYYIISKFKLSTELYRKSTDTFFDELFDTLLNVQSHKDMKSLKGKNVSLSLDDLRRITKVAFLWNSSTFRNSEEFMAYTLIERSRYSRYANIAYQILLTNENMSDDERLSQVYECFSVLSKVFFCYSVKFSKAVNDIHRLMNNVYRSSFDYQNNKESLFAKLREKLQENNNQWFKDNYLGDDIAYNRIRKNLICILSDYFDELENGVSLSDLEKLYQGDFDIEHIHANANEDEANDVDDELQNGIGNLMLLEYDINRSIGCLPFNEKKQRSDGKLCYKDSCYATVKKIRTYENWGLCEIEQRRKEEIEKISKYLFS